MPALERVMKQARLLNWRVASVDVTITGGTPDPSPGRRNRVWGWLRGDRYKSTRQSPSPQAERGRAPATKGKAARDRNVRFKGTSDKSYDEEIMRNRSPGVNFRYHGWFAFKREAEGTEQRTLLQGVEDCNTRKSRYGVVYVVRCSGRVFVGR